MLPPRRRRHARIPRRRARGRRIRPHRPPHRSEIGRAARPCRRGGGRAPRRGLRTARRRQPRQHRAHARRDGGRLPVRLAAAFALRELPARQHRPLPRRAGRPRRLRAFARHGAHRRPPARQPHRREPVPARGAQPHLARHAQDRPRRDGLRRPARAARRPVRLPRGAHARGEPDGICEHRGARRVHGARREARQLPAVRREHLPARRAHAQRHGHHRRPHGHAVRARRMLGGHRARRRVLGCGRHALSRAAPGARRPRPRRRRPRAQHRAGRVRPGRAGSARGGAPRVRVRPRHPRRDAPAHAGRVPEIHRQRRGQDHSRVPGGRRAAARTGRTARLQGRVLHAARARRSV